MVGTGGQPPGGNAIVALDPQTGKEAWRFYTIAQPGEPGGDSWNGAAARKSAAALRCGLPAATTRAEPGLLRTSGKLTIPGRCCIR